MSHSSSSTSSSSGSGSSSSSSCEPPTCVMCNSDLHNCRAIDAKKGTLCQSCFEMEYANRCNFCKKLVRLDQQEIAFDGMHWHDTCFNCSLCNSSLVKKCFAFSNSQLVCIECHDRETSIECCRCLEKFKNGQPIYEFDGKYWHDDCFRCFNCDFPIGSRPFIPGGSNPVCIDCFNQKFIRYCRKCGKSINNEGMECGDVYWHNECFACFLCGKSLCSSGEFLSKEKDIYCTECYSKKFFKKCVKCCSEIETLRGLKFVNFENRNWHARCFSCQRCNCGLMERGFVMFGSDIMCPSCAKTKL